MTDTGNHNKKTAENHQQSGDEIVLDENVNNDSGIELPANHVIRKRIAARTIGVHLSALPPELQELKDTDDNAYLARRDLPDKVTLTVFGGDKKEFTRDEIWELADKAGEKLEWDMLPDSLAGKATALFSSTGQGVYANYGRPSMDFSSFFYDSGQLSAASKAAKGKSSVLLGPIFITIDTVSAAGFTALGHFTRDARLADKTVVADVASTGVYEGSTSWTSAKLGVFTGIKAIRMAANLPIPGAHLAAVPIGFLVGATTAILVKHYANQFKDKAIDVSHQSLKRSKVTQTA